jgi:hypothetical protein
MDHFVSISHTIVYHQYIVFHTLHSTTPPSERSSPLTFKIVRTFGHRLIFFGSFCVVGDLLISFLNIFWHPSATPGIPRHLQANQVARYLYLVSFVMKVLHYLPHTPATQLRNAIKTDRTGEEAAEELFRAMEVWPKTVERRWFPLYLPTLVVTLAAVVVWSGS